MLAYPTREQFAEAIGIVVEIVREGKVVERKAEFAKGLWIALGFLQSVVIGDPIAPLGAAGIKPMLGDLKFALQGILDDEVLSAGFDWVLIMKLVQLILEFIDQFRD